MIRMIRRIVVCLLPTVLLLLISPAETQQTRKVPRIGFLFGASLSSHAADVEAFRVGLRELGYIEGKNITVDYRSAEG